MAPLFNDGIQEQLYELITYFMEKKRNSEEKHRLVIVVHKHDEINHILSLFRQSPLRELTHNLRAVPLAARNHLCINQSLNPGRGRSVGNINQRCNDMRHKSGCNPCPFYRREGDHARTLLNAPAADQNIMDIESLCASGQQEHVCPYFSGREIAHNFADIVVTPYNYVIDDSKGTRYFYKEVFRGSTLFFFNSEDILSLGFEDANGSVVHQKYLLSKRIDDLLKLKPFRLIFTTNLADEIEEKVRNFLHRKKFEVILPKPMDHNQQENRTFVKTKTN